MTDSGLLRRRAARALIAIVGIGAPLAGVGLSLFAAPPSTTPTASIPCVDDVCTVCIAPTPVQCQRLTLCGGEPCSYDVGGSDPYAGAAGQLGRALRRLGERGALTTWHTDIVSTSAGAVTDCATVVYLSRDQRAAWRRTVDADGVGSEVVDCRFATTAAKFKRGASRRSVLSGMPVDGSDESAPDDAVDTLDAGVE